MFYQNYGDNYIRISIFWPSFPYADFSMDLTNVEIYFSPLQETYDQNIHKWLWTVRNECQTNRSINNDGILKLFTFEFH